MTADVRPAPPSRMLPEGDAHVFGEIRSGALGARLAVTQAEIEAAQTLRYRVFYDEMGANPDPAIAATGRDRDAYDRAPRGLSAPTG
jgi:putative hemolysin